MEPRARTFASATSATVGILAVIGIVLLMREAWLVVEPLLISIVLASGMWGPVSWLAQLRLPGTTVRVPRLLATGLVYLIGFTVIGVAIALIILELVPHIDRVLGTAPQYFPVLDEWAEVIRVGGLAAALDLPVDLAGLIDRLTGGILTVILVFVFTFFFLLHGDLFARWSLMVIPPRRRALIATIGVTAINKLGRWVLGIGLYAITTSLIVGGLMWLLGMPVPWLFALAAFILVIAPGLGPPMVFLPAVAIAFASGMDAPAIAAVVIVGALFWVADAVVISPRIMGRVTQISPFLVLLAVLFGSIIMGAWGALIAVPVVVVARVLIESVQAARAAAAPPAVAADG